MAAYVFDVIVEAEFIAAVENLVTLRTEVMFYIVFRDQFGRQISDGTILAEYCE